MRSTEERLAAVKDKALEIKAARSKRKNRLILASACAASLLILVGLSFFIPSVLSRTPAPEPVQPGATASIFDVSGTLGYILIGFFAFALGAAMTILFYRIQLKNKKEQGGKHDRAA
ncbi:MAG: hypothetical protein WDA02_09700 [Saccharofermentanales bacterium]|jgi:hypothetical protein